jgi:hypothetical protein
VARGPVLVLTFDMDALASYWLVSWDSRHRELRHLPQYNSSLRLVVSSTR